MSQPPAPRLRTELDREAMALICTETRVTTNRAMEIWDRLCALSEKRPPEQTAPAEGLTAALKDARAFIAERFAEAPVRRKHIDTINEAIRRLEPQASDGQGASADTAVSAEETVAGDSRNRIQSEAHPKLLGDSQPEFDRSSVSKTVAHPTPPQGSGETSIEVAQGLVTDAEEMAALILSEDTKFTKPEREAIAAVVKEMARTIREDAIDIAALTAASAHSAVGPLADAEVESLIEGSGGYWREDHFVIVGSELTDMLQSAAKLHAQSAAGAEAVTAAAWRIVEFDECGRSTGNCGSPYSPPTAQTAFMDDALLVSEALLDARPAPPTVQEGMVRIANALAGLIGYVQLLSARYDDLPLDNHRVLEAIAAHKEFTEARK